MISIFFIDDNYYGVIMAIIVAIIVAIIMAIIMTIINKIEFLYAYIEHGRGICQRST